MTRLRLGRLADGEIAELVTGLLPADAASEDRVEAVVGAADGNPLYARELAHAAPQALPASIADAVLAKAAGLTAQARAVVDQVCVADGGMSHELLAAAVPLPEKRLLASARRAVASGLLVPADDGYACNHGLTRQVLYASCCRASGGTCTTASRRPWPRGRTQTPGCWPSTGIGRAQRTGLGRRLCWPRARRSRNAPTQRPCGLTCSPSN